ncbi:DNA polymerase III delta subunit [Tenacibaculum sp. 190524A02b]|uniref:hypothetical protein n=1 Tax=Tenacibaculum vairaonense TaxID=3137860 RepID=UPI0032B1E867
MKSPVQLSNEIVKLKEAYKEGRITKQEVINEYKSILDEISSGLGNSHPIVIQLYKIMDDFISRLESIKVLDKELEIVNSEKLYLYKNLELQF